MASFEFGELPLVASFFWRVSDWRVVYRRLDPFPKYEPLRMAKDVEMMATIALKNRKEIRGLYVSMKIRFITVSCKYWEVVCSAIVLFL